MDSSALPSYVQNKELGYYESRTLAREQGLKVTGRLEQILERLLKLQAETGPAHNLDGHSSGAAPCSASGSGTATKENIGTTPQESTARKRKEEEIESETARQSRKILVDSNVINTDVPLLPPSSQPAPVLFLLPPSPPPSPGARQRPPGLALRVSSSHHLIISTMAPRKTQKRTAARRHIGTPNHQVLTVSRQRADNTPNAPEEPVVPDADSAASATEQEIPFSARKVRGALVDARKYTAPLRRSTRLSQALSPLSTEKLTRMLDTIVHDLFEFKPNIYIYMEQTLWQACRFSDVGLLHPHVQLYTRTRDAGSSSYFEGRHAYLPCSYAFATSP
ncbi:hypothetical protein DFH11DRAFT_89595 [Phellopilus nigrolimitatus]|nr:hypothetical protein DFH11DRAFT_89595 [Phellopilus nigrolimitatus]